MLNSFLGHPELASRSHGEELAVIDPAFHCARMDLEGLSDFGDAVEFCKHTPIL